ncbi:MAG: coagulation factor 5/8 type domain-containing protein [Bryobacterales bacterium]|nr:coagulation factor 5/8 type domain-containing protein [Bryobacterales bacterium]
MGIKICCRNQRRLKPRTSPVRFGPVLVLFAYFAGMSLAAAAPDFGPNVLVFTPSTPAASVQEQINRVYAIQEKSQFGAERFALLFQPGAYSVDIPVGFYTQVIGLGAAPASVHIQGNVHSDAYLPNNNATCNFWRAIEGFSVTPSAGVMQWAVSQAISFRRMHIHGDVVLHQKGGWSSGGWMSDSLVDGNVGSGSQQQWISRNTEWGGWTGSNWNMVFVGVVNPPAGEWPAPPYTKVARTPVVREKPYLEIDARGNYSVRVPALRSDSLGVSWRGGSTPGKSIPLSQFYIARPGADTAASINAQLAKGKHLLLTPGIYELTGTLRVTRANTVVLGLGYATLRPANGVVAMTTADVDGLVLAGLLFDAGPASSPALLEVGPSGSKARHARNPISLHDVYFRVGGAALGRASASLKINAHDTIVDHTWVWRADHGAGVGWNSNTAANGLVVNGDDVTIYGLFVEHYQEYQVVWNGNGGRVYFYQSEIPYDPPDQPGYTSAPGVNGWASYKVADGVSSHQAWGLGIYSVFRNRGVVLTRAIEAPENSGVKFHHAITVCIGANGEISNVINNTGGATTPNVRHTPKITSFP